VLDYILSQEFVNYALLNKRSFNKLSEGFMLNVENCRGKYVSDPVKSDEKEE
jgi:hypothetical protein